jgi:hypothetical protein
MNESENKNNPPAVIWLQWHQEAEELAFMAEQIKELEAALQQTNRLIKVQIKNDIANAQPERAGIWDDRLRANEQALAGAEEE